MTTADPDLEEFGGPAAERAYKPSGQGTILGTVLMTLGGLAAGTFFGKVSPALGEGIMDVCVKFGFIGIIFGFAFMFFIIPVLSGMGIGWVVGQAALLGKSRDLKACVWISVIGAVITVVLYCIARINDYQAEAFDSFIDWFKVVFISFWILVMAAVFSADAMSGKPFCEGCQAYMKRRLSRRLAVESRPGLLSAGKEGRFEDFLRQAFNVENDASEQLYSQAICFYCPKCLAKGFLNLDSYKVTVTYSRGQENRKVSERCIFSVALPSDTVKLFVPAKADKA